MAQAHEDSGDIEDTDCDTKRDQEVQDKNPTGNESHGTPLEP